jgi:hypothetical protein
MNINGKEYVEAFAFHELHRVNMGFVDEIDNLRAENQALRELVDEVIRINADDSPKNRGCNCWACEWIRKARAILAKVQP